MTTETGIKSTHKRDISAQLRTRNIIVRCHVSRYVGADVQLSGFGGVVKEFSRFKKGVAQSPREVQEFLNNNALKEVGILPKIDQFGGVTEVFLVDVNSGGFMGHGKSICHNEDVFHRQLGFRKALRRAMKVAGLEKIKYDK